MRMTATMLCAAAICAALASAGRAAATLYVAPGGSDAAAGTRAAPFATLERARDALRAMKQAGGLSEGGATVYLRAGTYERREPFALAAADGGTETAAIVYRSEPGAEVRIAGGRAVTGFKPIPMDRIGLYKDERRASWPVTHTPRELPDPPAQKR
jgi:hypothetical protein